MQKEMRGLWTVFFRTMRIIIVQILLLCAWLLMGPVWAQEGNADSSSDLQEFELITRIFEGEIGEASICLAIVELGPFARAEYWPRQGACDLQSYMAEFGTEAGRLSTNEKGVQDSFWDGWESFSEEGPATNLFWTLHETPTQGASPATLTGESRSSRQEGESRIKEEIQALHFTQTAQVPFFADIPYRITLVLDRSSDEGVTFTKAIRLYDHTRLVQELSTDSQNDDMPFLPDVVDLNFDGHEDLMLIMMLPITPSISYQYWLYNPKLGLFEVAPESLQDVTSPQLDNQHQQIISFWRGAASYHGIDVYQWERKNGQQEVVLKEQLSSYFMPVRDHGQMYYCYNVPVYDHVSGRAVFYDMIVRQPDGSYQLRGLDNNLDGCDSTIVSIPYLYIWEDRPDGPVIVQELGAYLVPVENDGSMKWALEIPYFDLQSQKIGQYVDMSELWDQ